MRSCRRIFLDEFLEISEKELEGDIIDIGGEKFQKKGNYRPYKNRKIKSWKYLNTNEKKKPDFLISAEKITELNLKFDGFILCEVLEHLENPETVLEEISESLRTGGIGIITIPFLVGEHADPNDYQRYLPNKLKIVLNKVGLETKKIYYMGGLSASIFDLILLKLYYNYSFFTRIVIKILHYLQIILLKFTNGLSTKRNKFTTGYGLIVKKIF